MEPTNHLFRKENDLPNLDDYVQHVNLRGCKGWPSAESVDSEDSKLSNLPPHPGWEFHLFFKLHFPATKQWVGVDPDGWRVTCAPKKRSLAHLKSGHLRT